MADYPMIEIYMTDNGPKKVDDLTREEAIAAVKHLGQQLQNLYAFAKTEREMQRIFREARAYQRHA